MLIVFAFYQLHFMDEIMSKSNEISSKQNEMNTKIDDLSKKIAEK